MIGFPSAVKAPSTHKETSGNNNNINLYVVINIRATWCKIWPDTFLPEFSSLSSSSRKTTKLITSGPVCCMKILRRNGKLVVPFCVDAPLAVRLSKAISKCVKSGTMKLPMPNGKSRSDAYVVPEVS